MWSPPRARSTLMMRVFEAIGCDVFDEPFYACWLKALDKRDDPGFAETLAAHETHQRAVIEQVLSAGPNRRDWFYQKHMAIHMLPEVDLGWMADHSFTHCFLIRDPREVIASMTEFRDLRDVYLKSGPEAAAELVGIPQLQRIYDHACALSPAQPPPVIDANSFLEHPISTLTEFCGLVGLPFDPEVELAWAPGQHADDGAWAPFWYKKVFATTGLKPFSAKHTDVEADLQAIVDVCMPTYERLYAQRVGQTC